MPPLRNASYASERTCTVHQVLVASQKEGGDPGTYPAALLDAALTKVTIGSKHIYTYIFLGISYKNVQVEVLNSSNY